MRLSVLSLMLLLLIASCREQPAVDTTRAGSAPEAKAPVPTTAPEPAAKGLAPIDVVAEFGRRMKLVSTAAPAPAAAAAIREHYAGLAAPELLEQWASSPATAPGREVSSPWPERIEVLSSSQSGFESDVDAILVEVTSTGEAGRRPVRLRLADHDGTWLITRWELGARSR
jgi:hypothetical protein